MFIDSSLAPKFKAANKTREQFLIESLDLMVRDTRIKIDIKPKLVYNLPRF